MAAYNTNRAQFDTAGFAGRIGYAFTTAFNMLSAWNDNRVTRYQLGKLSDRELDDIGLSRSAIENIG